MHDPQLIEEEMKRKGKGWGLSHGSWEAPSSLHAEHGLTGENVRLIIICACLLDVATTVTQSDLCCENCPGDGRPWGSKRKEGKDGMHYIPRHLPTCLHLHWVSKEALLDSTL